MIDAMDRLLSDGIEHDVESLWACMSEETLRRTVGLARRVQNTPYAMLVSSTADGQVVRWSSDALETDGSLATLLDLCQHVVSSGSAIAIPAVAEHPVFLDIPPGQAIPAYLGVPIRLARGRIIGTLCVCDSVPHAWLDEDLDMLAMLATGLANEVELRHEIMRRDGAAAGLIDLPSDQAPVAQASPANAERPDAERPDAERADAESAEVGGARILLADDLDLNRKLIADMLACEGHSVDCVADGAAAVRAARDKSYDLILMDMIMPVMDGTAATRAIRALPDPACRVPIVALTAHSFREQLDACLAAGMDGTLTKPLSMATLTTAVDEWTRGRTKAA